MPETDDGKKPITTEQALDHLKNQINPATFTQADIDKAHAEGRAEGLTVGIEKGNEATKDLANFVSKQTKIFAEANEGRQSGKAFQQLGNDVMNRIRDAAKD